MGRKEQEQIYKTVKVINKALEKKLFVECQECVMALQKQIGKMYGENVQTVKRLEHLGGLLTQIDQENVMQEIRILLEEIEEGLPVDLKKEIVFLPYKASMWDSLESVWKAFQEDEAYIVRVIPIPYFDKDENGEYKEAHWEGEEFPSYVPITRYDEYDLEEHHPDMIFIHNPYDQYNAVTSVHPDYYSSRIKDYTDKLVYIPYFILDEIKPFNSDAINLMKHYCLTPAIQNADYVIVQSEDMRQIYINVLSKVFGQDTRVKWEKKILGLGSPKVDKALASSKENVVIPEEWMKLIVKEDGSWKHIVFYNISLGALLVQGVNMLDKIESVISFFKENTDELVLLWRPHPLYMSTMESMEPSLKERYVKIVEQYIQEGWGIYDDTSDMDRAIAISDVYYGDGSSVARLYAKTNKKLMFQNPGLK